MNDTDISDFRKKSGWIIVLILIWGIFSLTGVFCFSVIKRPEYQAKARETAWRQGTLPALKGTVYASDGTVLAASRLEFFLIWDKEKIGKAVRDVLARPIRNGGKISEAELPKLEELTRRYPRNLRIKTIEQRNTSPFLKKIEKKYSHILQGQDGLFVVMFDRYGRRVPGTLKVIRQQIPGRSVTLTPEEEADNE